MIPFQYAGIFVCLLFAIWGLVRLQKRRRPGWLSLLAVVLGLAGAVAIYDPEITTRVARVLGIARGADLLIYIVALAFLGSWFYFYQRIRTLSNAVTLLVREMAVRFPSTNPGASGEDNRGGGPPPPKS